MSRRVEHLNPTLGQYAAGVAWLLFRSPLTLALALSLAGWVAVVWAAKLILGAL